MKRSIGLSAMLVLGAALVAPGVGAEEKKKGKVPSISEIMTAAHKGAESAREKAKAALKDKDYEDLGKYAKKLTQLGTDLSKNKPPKGAAKSWKNLTSTYIKNAKALQKAAADKNAGGAKKALDGIGGLCAKCHTAHKED
jgi:hypothetical protein